MQKIPLSEFLDIAAHRFGAIPPTAKARGLPCAKSVMGPISRSQQASEGDLVMFGGAHYSDPTFSWLQSMGVTDIEFLNSTKLGKYAYNVFVGDINNGNLYYFTVNDRRDGLVLEGDLSDLVADSSAEESVITLGTGFGGITDIKTGPDGYLYILSYGAGCVYRIVPASQ